MSDALPAAQAAQAAVARLARSRAHLHAAWQAPAGTAGGGWGLAQPLRLLQRWWRVRHPASVLLREALRTADSALAGDPAQADAQWRRLRDGGVRWVRRHPGMSVVLALGAGALLVHQRSALRGVALGVGAVLGQQVQSWLVRRLSDPALYRGFFADSSADPLADSLTDPPAPAADATAPPR